VNHSGCSMGKANLAQPLAMHAKTLIGLRPLGKLRLPLFHDAYEDATNRGLCSWEVGGQVWVAIRWSLSAALRLEQGTKPSSLDGCPMFAPAYMGRKRILQMLSLYVQGLLLLAAVFVHPTDKSEASLISFPFCHPRIYTDPKRRCPNR
jgi:hypothetical protein